MKSFGLSVVILLVFEMSGCATRKAEQPPSFESQMARIRKLSDAAPDRHGADSIVCAPVAKEVFPPLPEYFRLLPEPDTNYFSVNQCNSVRECEKDSSTGSVFARVLSEPNTLEAAPVLKWQYVAENDLCVYSQTIVRLSLQGDDLIISGRTLVFEVPKRCDYAQFDASKLQPKCTLTRETRAVY